MGLNVYNERWAIGRPAQGALGDKMHRSKSAGREDVQFKDGLSPLGLKAHPE